MLPNSIEDIFVRHGLSVSRETLDQFNIYHALLIKWQRAINLVGPTTLEEAPLRHFYDSAQLIKHLPGKDIVLADMGSGAGFPGMVLAILGIRDVHLIESDVRKATFLREVSRETSVSVTIHDTRVEDCTLPPVDVFTARALAPLVDLLKHMHRARKDSHPCVGFFMKGAQFEDELAKARKKWQFAAEIIPSETDVSGRIIKVSKLDTLACGLK